MTTAADVMTREVISVREDAPCLNALFTLIENEISGMPVVNEKDEMVGIITEKDLINYTISGTIAHIKVKEAMTKEVVSFPADAPFDKLCLNLVERNFRRLPIMEEKRVVGIVSRRDLLRSVARSYGRR